MPQRLQQPRPMMACTAGLDRDHRRCKLLEERHHFLAPQLLTQNRHFGSIHAMKLENMLRRIHADADNLVHGRSPLSEINNNDLILACSMPPGAVHTNSRCAGRGEGLIFCCRFAVLSTMARSAPASDRDSILPTIRSRKWQL